MATVRNPINQSTVIDLLPTIQKLVPAYGMISTSGLFKEQGVKTNFAAFEIDEAVNTPMTKLTSRTERDSVKVGRGKSKWVTFKGETLKINGSVHVEDLQNVLTTWNIETDKSLQQAVADRTEDLYNSWTQSYEYMLLTASQGRMRDPEDGRVAIDMFENTGTTQTAVTIDVRPTVTNLKSQLHAIVNRLNTLNQGLGAVQQVDFIVADNVFDAIISHPEFQEMYIFALQGRGQEALRNPILNGTANTPVWTSYGFVREFRFENIVFKTQPQTFVRMGGEQTKAIEDGKGWTIVKGVRDLYNVNFAPPSYFSQLGAVGQKLYARSTGIVDDTHLDITMESHLTPFMKRPEMAIDLTFTLA